MSGVCCRGFSVFVCDTLADQLDVHVVAPDCFRGKTKADVPGDHPTREWLQAHPFEDVVANDTEACLHSLALKGVDRQQVGAVGFCWGGWAIVSESDYSEVLRH